MSTPNEWNNLVPIQNRLESPNKNARRPSTTLPTHVVIHVTGTDSLPSVRKTFLASNSVSAHYLITKEGELFQFVPDASRAWHAGIDSNTRSLYKKGQEKWQCYLKYFNWYKGYPKDAIYVDGDLKPVWDKTEAAFVARADGLPWPEYSYFNERWPTEDLPINFDTDPDPNNYAIGIETLDFGSKKHDSTVYTDKMYKTLEHLVTDISKKYSIPMIKGRIVGHEDVNPIGRFGWDPAPGFDWSVVTK
ncbi:N-acetylmuramoyl-L-alanine amidase [Pseudomonas sp. BMS12]|uniref:N-acetylmuramoyl-L-alanine amidase n=1 Tax=Pseudomonas sp. BMS12 TaxID=1796033 RepID=UPI0009EEF4FB|nr:N-acetylmuramoyl-L-alanine amidase [Pseudomonas sp. BMS12]